MLSKNIETFLGCDAEYADATTVLFGAPFDSTTSYRPGTRFGSRAMRQESYGLETWSPYQKQDLTDRAIFDSGDLELPFGAPEVALQLIRERTAKILADGKRPFLLGGEHLVTLGAVEAVLEQYPDLHIIHFDAHADLRDEYLGITLSHASVIRRCWDLMGNGRIAQFGIRSGDQAEFQWGENHIHTQLFNFTGLAHILDTIGERPVYFTIDLDVLDPSCFPGTGTPEAGGVTFPELLDAIFLVLGQANVVACDLVELAPPLDPTGVSTATACKILREMLIAME
ncbi:MAG: agmatinase [Oscillospiraceae bacterium]|nr:agmatinase [Oscillospiraceae bacterium]